MQVNEAVRLVWTRIREQRAESTESTESTESRAIHQGTEQKKTIFS